MKVGVGLGAYLEVAQTLRHFSSGMRDIKDRKWKIENVCMKGREMPQAIRFGIHMLKNRVASQVWQERELTS